MERHGKAVAGLGGGGGGGDMMNECSVSQREYAV